MRTKQRVFRVGGLLAGVVALGCQAPPSSQPGAVATTPRTVVHVGAVKLEPDADMAIVLSRTDCGEAAKPGYALKQAGPDARVDHIVVEVTGPGLVEPYKKTLTRDAFNGGCDATLNLAGLATGSYAVRFTSYNAAQDPVAYANGTVDVANGQTSQLSLVCDFDLGKLDVHIRCCDDGATPTPAPSGSVGPSVDPSGAPSVDPSGAPSATPTPVPSATATATPTPVPTATPSPFNPLTTHVGKIFGIEVDAQSRTYLLGEDPDPKDAAGKVRFDSGNVIRVGYPQPVPDATSFWEDMYPHYDAEITGDTIVLSNTSALNPDPYWTQNNTGKPSSMIRFLDVNTRAELRAGTRQIYWSWDVAAEPNAAIPNGVWLPWTRSTQIIIRSATNHYWSQPIKDKTNYGVPVPYASGDYATMFHFRSHRFATATEMVWTCPKGIVKNGPNPADRPILLLDTAANGMKGVFALEQAGNGDYLVSREQETKLYRWNPAAPTTFTEVFDFVDGYPRQIEAGPSGSVYVLTYQGATRESTAFPIDTAGRFPATKFRVTRLEPAAGGALGSPTRLVATY